jgi:hypothetical protein
MKVTGFLLREALRRWELRRDTAASQFESSLMRFPDEDKPAPDSLATAFVDAEHAISCLQVAQARYNLLVTIEVMGAVMPLCQGVKRLGGAGRLDKLWRSAVGEKKDRYGMRDEHTRRADETRAVRVMSIPDAMVRANRAAVFAGALRAAIAKGNGTEIPTSDLLLDPALLTE